MKKYRCNLCGYIYECEELPLDFVCPVCGVDYSNFNIYVENEVDKRVKISEDNPAIYRINEKCINCGQCKDTCENKVGIKYDVDKASDVICINCGQCVLGCPAGALVPKYNYKDVYNMVEPLYKEIVEKQGEADGHCSGQQIAEQRRHVAALFAGRLSRASPSAWQCSFPGAANGSFSGMCCRQISLGHKGL